MADSGLAVVTNSASSVKQQQDESTIECVSIANRLTSSASSPVQPTNETDETEPQHTSNNTGNNQGNNKDVPYDLEKLKSVTPLGSGAMDSPAQSDSMSKSDIATPISALDKEEPAKTDTSPEGGGSSQQIDSEAVIDPSALPEKTNPKYEETIIEDFAICAFKSWEDLQDELNERIALEKAKNKDSAPSEMSAGDLVIKKEKKKKSRSKHKDVISIKSEPDGPGTFSQTKGSKSKETKKVEGITKKRKKSATERSEKTGSSAKATDKKQKVSSNSELSRDSTTINRKPSSLPESDSQSTNGSQTIGPDQVNPNRSKPNNPSNPSASQSPKVHNQSIHETTSHQPNPPSSIHNQDATHRNPNQALPYSPYGNNPHPHKYDTTSQDNHSMHHHPPPPSHHHPHPHPHHHHHQNPHPHPGARVDQSDTKKDSQQEQGKQPTAPHANSSSQSTQPQMPYHHNPSMFPPHQHMPSNMNHGASHYHPGMNQARPSNPYFYAPMGPTSQTTGPPLPPYHQSYYPPQPHSSYPSPYLATNQSPYYPPHDSRNPYMAHPFNMYPPAPSYQQHPQQSSSIVSSIRMSSLPAVYGPPFIITDTTISRQTSVVPPPMPTALEQAAATSVASRFGHHPSTIHSMNHYNAAAAAAAASAAVSAAAASGQPHPQPPTSSLYPGGPAPTEKSFLELSRTYNGVPNSSLSTATYSSLANAAYTPSATYPSNPYNFDRWPRASLEHHQQAASSFGLHHAGNPLLADRHGASGPKAPFPAGIFPPPTF